MTKPNRHADHLQISRRHKRRLCVATCVLTAIFSLVLTNRAFAQADAHEHEFFFSRGIYSSVNDGDEWGPRWAIDYPEADRHFLIALQRLTNIDAYSEEHALPFGSESIREFPFVYVVEVGGLQLPADDQRALRAYLLAGGFLVIDDFWGSAAWSRLVAQMKQILPDRAFRDVPLDHPIFHSFYDIDTLLQVPNFALVDSNRTHEHDGYVPRARGIFDDQGRLMVLANWNTDLGDAWEWADDASYPLRYSNYAYRLGINIIIYAMSF